MADDLNKLLEWIIFYAKNKDIIKKEIKEYKILKNYVEFEYKDKKHIYYAYPNLTDDIIEASKDGWITVVCLNNPENLKYTVSNWDKLIKNPKFSMIFANPKTNQRWIIFPHTHNKITEKETLKLGLEAMAAEVSQA
jgi:hypothetical protein